jgi:hypothetical protein
MRTGMEWPTAGRLELAASPPRLQLPEPYQARGKGEKQECALREAGGVRSERSADLIPEEEHR